jgi:hypothetical protein
MKLETALFRQAPKVLFTRLDEDSGALISTERRLPYALNTTGLLIWSLLAEGADLEGLTEALRSEFDVEPEQAREDSRAFLREMLAFGLVVCVEHPNP